MLNSVVQSFPGYNYLHRVLEDAIDLMADRGVIFLGDLMDLDLKPALEADTAAYKRQHPHRPTKTDWSDELFVPQGLLRDLVGRLPGVVRAECSRKPGDNELARYRFDCILYVEKGATVQADPPSRCRYDRRQLSVVSCQLSAPEGSRRIHPDSAAYLMYTSGTTGKQKGVVVTHSNLLQYLTWAADHYARRQPVNMPLFTSPGFDLTITSLFLPLVTGGRLLTLGAAPLDRLLREAFTHQSVTALKLTPSHISALGALGLEAGGQGLEENRPHSTDSDPIPPPSPQPPAPSLSLAIVGGEPLLAEHCAILRSHNPAIRIINEYGPTEATVGCTVETVTAEPITIGRPIAGAAIRILDRHGHPLTPGVPGELCIAGQGLARGYNGSPALTADRFVPDPSAPGQRCYRTGDKAEWSQDGNLVFLGRLDRQVKIRGNRIELGDSEAALRALPEVASAAVDMVGEDLVLPSVNTVTHRGRHWAAPWVPGERVIAGTMVSEPGAHGADSGASECQRIYGRQYLVAWIVPTNPASTQDELQRLLASRLPPFLAPTRLVLLPALPLTRNGKLDRPALLRQLDRQDEDTKFTPPQGEMEQAIAESFAEVLGLPRVGRETHFFKSGGHSLKAVRAAAALRQKLGWQVPLSPLMQTPKVRHLATNLSEIQRFQQTHGQRIGLWLRQTSGPTVFCFPPILGFAESYQQMVHHLAPLLPDYSFYSFDFPESGDPLVLYEQTILQLQPEDPYIFLGYSAGGNLAFELTKRLESQGERPVARLILIDSLHTRAEPEDRSAERAELHQIFQAMATDPHWCELTSNDAVKSMIESRLKSFIRYFRQMDNHGSVAADLHFLAAQTRPNDPSRAPAWRESTAGQHQVAQGSGTHSEMWQDNHIQINVTRLAGLLAESFKLNLK